MPRPKSANPPVEIHVSLPGHLVRRMDGFLFSDLEQRVPYGARADLIASLIKNYLDIVAPEGDEECI